MLDQPISASGFFDLGSAPVLETERLILRAPQAGDRDAWMAFLVSERGVWHGCGPQEGVGRAYRMFATLVGHWAMHGFGPFVVVTKDDGRAVGSVGPFFPPDWPERELGWAVWSAEAEGQGYAFEAARAARDDCFGRLGWTALVSYIDPNNVRSVALAERLGATRDDVAARPHPDDLVFRHRQGAA